MPRYLIEAAAGVYTGSVYNDKSILQAGHHGEARSYRDGSTLLQKTHHRALTVDRYKVREGDNIILCTWKYCGRITTLAGGGGTCPSSGGGACWW